MRGTDILHSFFRKT